MPELRWTGPGLFTDHGRDFVAHPGVHDVSDEQEEEYLNHPQHDGWERADDAEAAESADDSDAVDAPLDPSEYTVADLEDELESGDYSGDELDAIESAEQDGKDRDTALEAIDEARRGN